MPQKPELSVIMCTYNPRADLLVRSLRALSTQTLDTSRYELIVVDNNSKPPLDRERLETLAGRNVDLHVEMRQGLTYGRVCGFEAASADLICFIDDDNELIPGYLEGVLAIAHLEPKLGVFGGICEGVFEKRVGWLQRAVLPHLGIRNLGTMNRTGTGEKWGEHEPIGAGIVVRKPVGQFYIKFVNNASAASGLGRTGGQLLSGEDSLLSRMGSLLGYKIGYRPDLRLRHYITSPRLKLKYLKRLMEGHGRSYVNLERIMGRTIEPLPKGQSLPRIVSNFRHKRKQNGIRHALLDIYWDKGFIAQSRLQDRQEQNLIDFYNQHYTDVDQTPVQLD